MAAEVEAVLGGMLSHLANPNVAAPIRHKDMVPVAKRVEIPKGVHIAVIGVIVSPVFARSKVSLGSFLAVLWGDSKPATLQKHDPLR